MKPNRSPSRPITLKDPVILTGYCIIALAFSVFFSVTLYCTLLDDEDIKADGAMFILLIMGSCLFVRWALKMLGKGAEKQEAAVVIVILILDYWLWYSSYSKAFWVWWAIFPCEFFRYLLIVGLGFFIAGKIKIDKVIALLLFKGLYETAISGLRYKGIVWDDHALSPTMHVALDLFQSVAMVYQLLAVALLVYNRSRRNRKKG